MQAIQAIGWPEEKILLCGPGNSTEECKLLKDYSTKYAAQRPHKEEAWSEGNKKRGKTVQFGGTIEEVNRMTARDAPIPRKKNGGGSCKEA